MIGTPAPGLDRAALIAAVQRSPELVAAHGRDAWLALFAEDYDLQDPVGASPVRPDGAGKAPLARFWDTFIAPNEVRFDVHGDVVLGLTVARDVTIITRTPQGVLITTPAHLFYELEQGPAGLVVRTMHAHWELRPVLRQSLRPTWAHVRALASQNARMIRLQGIRGAMAFGRAAHSLGEPARQQLRSFVLEEGILDVTERVIVAGSWVTASGRIGGRTALVRAELDPPTLNVLHYTCFVESSE